MSDLIVSLLPRVLRQCALASLGQRSRVESLNISIRNGQVHRKIRFIAIKEGIELNGKQDLQTKVMIALFGLFSEDERDLISERTKEGLAVAEAQGKMLSPPQGQAV